MDFNQDNRLSLQEFVDVFHNNQRMIVEEVEEIETRIQDTETRISEMETKLVDLN